MALLWMDGVDHYTTSNWARKWSAVGSNTTTIETGRFGNGIRCSNQGGMVQTVSAGVTTLFCGFAFYKNTANPYNGTDFFAFQNGGGVLCEMRIDGNNRIYGARNGSAYGYSNYIIQNFTWYHIQIKVIVGSGTGGTLEWYLNGVLDRSISSIDTSYSGAGDATQVRFGQYTSSTPANMRFDDMWAVDTSGSINTSYIGDVRVETLYPSGNGNSSQLTGQDADSTDNYLNVDETTPDDDSTYNESSTVSDKDTYAYGNLATTSGSVKAVQICPMARKTDAGTRSIKAVAREGGGTEADSASDLTLSTSYLYFLDVREEKPSTGTWSISDVNGAEFGVKVTA